MVLGEEIGKLFSHMLYLRQWLNTQAVIHFGVSLSLARTIGDHISTLPDPRVPRPGLSVLVAGLAGEEAGPLATWAPCTHWGVCIW